LFSTLSAGVNEVPDFIFGTRGDSLNFKRLELILSVYVLPGTEESVINSVETFTEGTSKIDEIFIPELNVSVLAFNLGKF
jgi:hypothetical protein